jgi:hypothetical protein
MSEVLSIKAKSSVALAAARTKAEMFGAMPLIEVEPMMTEKRTLLVIMVSYSSRRDVSIQFGNYVREDVANPLYFPTGNHSDALPESQTHTCIDDKILPGKHNSIHTRLLATQLS